MSDGDCLKAVLLQVSAQAKEIERLRKLEIPDLKIERDGAKYESDVYEKRLEDANRQVEEVRKTAEHLLDVMARRGPLYPEYAEPIRALRAAAKGCAEKRKDEGRTVDVEITSREPGKPRIVKD